MHRCADDTNLRRREFFLWAGSMAALLTSPSVLRAQAYPTRSLHLLVGFPAGGAADLLARSMAAWLSNRLNQKVIVENKPGAGSSVATRAVLDLPPDGHTLLLIGSSTVVNGVLLEHKQPALLREITPVAGLTTSAFVVAVNAVSSHATLADLIAYAKENPGEIRVGSYGVGTQSQVAARLFSRYAGIEVTHVPYRGGALLVNDLLGQHIQVAFDTVGNSLTHIKSGSLRALAVTGRERLMGALSEVPAATEVLPGFEIVVWTGLGVRKGTPLAIVEQLNRECIAALGDPDIVAKLSNISVEPMPYSLDGLADFWSEEADQTRRLVREVNIEIE